MLNIFGGIIWFIKGATDGKISLDQIVDKAVNKASQSPSNELLRKDAPAVAEAIKDAMPAPRAMESLWPQVFRQALVFVGGLIVAKGWVSSEDWAVLSGAVLTTAPVIYRIASVLLARFKAR